MRMALKSDVYWFNFAPFSQQNFQKFGWKKKFIVQSLCILHTVGQQFTLFFIALSRQRFLSSFLFIVKFRTVFDLLACFLVLMNFDCTFRPIRHQFKCIHLELIQFERKVKSMLLRISNQQHEIFITFKSIKSPYFRLHFGHNFLHIMEKFQAKVYIF